MESNFPKSLLFSFDQHLCSTQILDPTQVLARINVLVLKFLEALSSPTHTKAPHQDLPTDDPGDIPEEKPRHCGASDLLMGYQKFKYVNLCAATNGFPEYELLGSGFYATVYRAAFLASSNMYTVKMIDYNSVSKQSYILEVMAIHHFRHQNILEQRGSCDDTLDEPLFLYDYMPYKTFIHVWLITLCAALPISSLFPFLYFMIRDLHVAKRVEDIGFYAGFVGSSFMLGRGLTSVFWGIVADRYGRKPVIIIGVITVVIFNTLFGLSTSYWMAIATRFLLGCLNGLLGPIKAYSVEIARPEYQAVGISLVSTAWAMGLVFGPSIGGLLAQPSEKFPHIFSKGSIFGRFPYFLPCLCISLFAAAVLSTCYWLPETLHMHHESKSENLTTEALEASFHGSEVKLIKEDFEGTDPVSNEKLFMNWPLMSSIIAYCVFSLHDMAYTEIFPLWAESGWKYGGLGFSSQDVGGVLAISGFSLLVFQLFLYPPLEKLIGHVNLCRASAILAIPLTASYPFMTKLSGFELTLIVNGASMLKNVLSMAVITGLFILQNNAVSQRQRGAANGISMCGQSMFKAIAPAAAGAIFSWAQKHQNSSFLPGNHMVFLILNLVEFVGLLMTFKPFLAYSTEGRK